ncbi:ABC transporter substrate-binding protein [Bacillus atrophaeus]|uniref:ABC transporter substrate-binding protein n=1 Tax=Bacillus atrophaeus TaxID=1452 RepID=UPI002280932C|nr:ABC transporter substrate-binding protein [Bacillus atrophaeus]MCY8838754.1 ABC transporter substrate-binding protein [Bacillus atrophaeus]MEC5221109.1 ABC transporter substrate-binding protein [Bacillus atrophaeus]MED4578187.1 ABC transporter substrate-binding protein [Bacillus atrophaeus]MED4721796.1 ABC transporter substrate-binding protein [Bacillus atrophaeus]
MNKWIQTGCAIVCSAFLIFALSACKQEAKLTKVKVAEVTHSIFYAPLYVAVSKGFFKEEGLDIEVNTTWGGDKTMTSLLSNGSDIALVGSETSIYVESQGAKDPVINFAQLTQTDGTFLVAREDIENFDWDMVKGKTFLGQRKGGMPQMAGEFVLNKHNIDPQKDVDLIQNIDFANIANAFASGTGDYVQLFEPTASLFEKEGIGHIVASFGEESGRVPYTTFMAKKSYLTEHEETAEKFTHALYKAQQWVEKHSSKKIAKAIQSEFDDTEPEIIEASIDRYKKQNSFSTDPLLNEKEWEQLQMIMDQAGELPKHIPYSQLVDTKIAKKVTSEK